MIRRGKYNVAPKEDRTYQGIVFDSKRELQFWLSFALLLEHGKIEKLERQVKFPLYAWNGKTLTKISSYVADFVVTEKGEKRVYDAKGFKTPTYRMKAKWLEAQEGIRIIEL